eukprot:SAG31_NODE_3961_length_3709_cov_7.355721_2_plen_621_part_00
MREWSVAGKAVTLAFTTTETCDFDREETKDVESSSKVVKDSSFFGKSETKVVTTIKEYFWRLGVRYTVYAYAGADDTARLALIGREGQYEVVTTTDTPPQQKTRTSTEECPVTAVLDAITAEMKVNFRIDRESAKTPRRNPDVEKVLDGLNQIRAWADQVRHSLIHLMRSQQERVRTPRTGPSAEPPAKYDLGDLGELGSEIFVPVLPLLEEHTPGVVQQLECSSEPATEAEEPAASPTGVVQVALRPTADEVSPLLSWSDLNDFLSAHKGSMTDQLKKIDKILPEPKDATGVLSQAEGVLVMVMHAVSGVATAYRDAVDYVENMLFKQLVAAVGKEVGPSDFADYMLFHNRKLFLPPYRPIPFSYAVRRSASHFPDGTVAVEQQGNSGGPIFTVSRLLNAPVPMSFQISAATEITLGGEQYIHGYMQHGFGSGFGSGGASLSLVGRARQFSSFMLLVGKLTSAHSFEPKHGIILQNKDEVKIPLILEQIPTAAEFRDAIESLSPEQQAFCTAYRKMQLEGNVFAVAVIQLKPALERVLNLPADSLTKEIRLTQDLLDLFITHQIPSDLLSFDLGAASNADGPLRPSEKVAAVAEHVKAIQDMLHKAKTDELEEAERKRM